MHLLLDGPQDLPHLQLPVERLAGRQLDTGASEAEGEDSPRVQALLCTAWELWFSVFGFGPWFKLWFPFYLLRTHLHR